MINRYVQYRDIQSSLSSPGATSCSLILQIHRISDFLTSCFCGQPATEPEVCQHAALRHRAQGAAVLKKQSKVLQSERLAASMEILGGWGWGRCPEPNTSLVCVCPAGRPPSYNRVDFTTLLRGSRHVRNTS